MSIELEKLLDALFLGESTIGKIVFRQSDLRIIAANELAERLYGYKPGELRGRTILAATHRDLKAEVSAGTFRLDLYYRLAVLEIISPPLRNRKEDIRLLVNHFLAWIAARDHRTGLSISDDAVKALEAYVWPGNIRELANTVERCACLSTSGLVQFTDVQAALQDALGGAAGPLTQMQAGRIDLEASEFRDVVNQNERQAIEVLLRRHRGNVSRAAKDANMTRQGLHKAMSRLGGRADRFRA